MDAVGRQGSSSQLSTNQVGYLRLSAIPYSCLRLSTTKVSCPRLSATQTICLRLSPTLVGFPPLVGRTQPDCHQWLETNLLRDISSRRLPQATSWHSTFQGKSKWNERGVLALKVQNLISDHVDLHVLLNAPPSGWSLPPRNIGFWLFQSGTNQIWVTNGRALIENYK